MMMERIVAVQLYTWYTINAADNVEVVVVVTGGLRLAHRRSYSYYNEKADDDENHRSRTAVI